MPTMQKELRIPKRRIWVVLRKELRYNAENFLEIMRRFADEHPEFAENVETITRILLQTEEEGAKTEEEATEEQQQEHQQQQEQATSPNA